jgi:3-oxoacyl-[acyl-carrier-protein] synthase-3
MTNDVPATPAFPAATPSAIGFTSGPPLYIASAASTPLPALPLADAVRDGLISEENAKITGMTSVAVADESTSVFDIASAAALAATSRADVPVTDIGAVLFANVFPYTRPRLYNMAAGLAEVVGAPCDFATELSGGCVAGLNALLLAAYRLLPSHDRAALIVAADVWRMPHIDRYNCEQGYIFADGASAVVVGRDAGFARILSAATLTDPTLSGIHAEVPSDRTPVDITARARNFLQTRMGTDQVLPRLRGGLRATIDAALAQARVDSLADVAHVLVPAIGEPFLYRNYLDPLDIPISRTTWDYSAVTGHTGAADQFSALAHLVDTGKCSSGDIILMIAEGLGFQWSLVVLQVR